nr:AAA family ATPase [Octadecabacter dasysiphoniae]
MITGCSGGGKSTLLAALAKAGFSTIKEPGRRIISNARSGADHTLPWVDMNAFARAAVEMAHADLKKAEGMTGQVFFDRGLVDAAVALQSASGASHCTTLGPHRHYAKTVFIAPPWHEIFEQDEDRKHGFAKACDEYDRLVAALDDLGYEPCILPQVSVADRVGFVLETLELTPE